MTDINRKNLYIGGKLVSEVYRGDQLVYSGMPADLPVINNPFWTESSVITFPPAPNTTIKSVSSKDLDLLKTLGFTSLIELGGFELPCPPGRLPTKADFVNLCNKISQIPSKLKVMLLTMADQLAEDVKQQIQEIIDTVNDIVEKISSFLSPYWTKGSVRNWEKEANDAWDELIQEFRIFIPVKMMEMISKLIPIDFEIVVLGIRINLLHIFERDEQLRIQTQIAQQLDELFPLLPDVYKFFNGEYGVKCNEWKAKCIWQYIKNELILGATNLLYKAFNALIKKFKKIWKLLKLPAIPDLLTMDVQAFIKGEIDKIKAKATKLANEVANFSLQGYLVEQLYEIEIFGYKVIDIIGGKIDRNVNIGEELIADLTKQIREWFAAWQQHLIFMWVEKIQKFLKKIGLGQLLALLTLTFCDVLKLLGIPTTFDLKLSV